MERIVVAISPPSIFTLSSLRFACFAGQVLRLPTSGVFGLSPVMLWVWCGFGVGMMWVCSGYGLDMLWVWRGSGVSMVWVSNEVPSWGGGTPGGTPPYTSVRLNLLLNRFTKSK